MYSHKGASTLATAQQDSARTCANDALNPSMTKDTRKVNLYRHIVLPPPHTRHHTVRTSVTQRDDGVVSNCKGNSKEDTLSGK